jgi:hypothetical protein
MVGMIMVAAAVFAADLLAVAAIVGSLWLERWLGLSRGEILDWMFVVAASYGAAAWAAGMFLQRELMKSQHQAEAEPNEIDAGPRAAHPVR